MDTGKNAILNADFKGRKSEKQIEKTDILSMEEHKTGSNALTMWKIRMKLLFTGMPRSSYPQDRAHR